MEKQCETPVGTGYAGLVLLAALIAIEMARSLTSDQMVLLGSFFEILGDNLDLLATSPSSASPCPSQQQNTAEE